MLTQQQMPTHTSHGKMLRRQDHAHFCLDSLSNHDHLYTIAKGKMIAMRNAVSIALLVLAAMSVQAQGFYYQSVMPDGRIVVGDKPAPGAKEVKQVPLRKGNSSAPLSSPAQAGAAGANPQRQAQEVFEAELGDAQQQLQSAKSALETGREPQAGERTGIAGGGSRLTDAYSLRIKALEDAAASAQKRVDEINARRNASR